jgi:hypothetical protein
MQIEFAKSAHSSQFQTERKNQIQEGLDKPLVFFLFWSGLFVENLRVRTPISALFEATLTRIFPLCLAV